MKFTDITLALIAALVFILAFLGYRPNSPNAKDDTSSKDTRKPIIRRPILPILPIRPKTFEGEEKHVVFENHNSPTGEEPWVDFPENEWIKNIGSKLDGAGMCVFSSLEMMFLWHGMEEFRGFRNWCAEHYKGGGYPDKVNQLLEAYCKAKNIQKPLIIQYVGDNSDFLEKALGNGWMPCCTLSHSKRYGPAPISHMVNCVQLTPKTGAIMDNNFKDYEWWTSKEACLTAMKYRDPNNGRQVYWGVVVVAPGPPPPPKHS